MSQATIRKLLDQRLAALTPEWETGWQNLEYSPKPGTSHQKTFLLPAAPVTISATYGGPSWLTGIYQVIVAVPPEGGPGLGDARADLIVAHFYRGLTLTDGSMGLTIPERPTIGPDLPDNSVFRQIPVSVPWDIIVDNPS